MNNYQDILTVSSKKELAKDVYEMVLEGQGAKYISAPGQFINIKINDSLQPYLRRPMSISEYTDTTITIVFKVVGEGSALLRDKEIGSKLDCLIGLGNGFTIKPSKKALLIGGGLGTPPLYRVAKELIKNSVEVTTVLGFGSDKDAFYVEAFKEFGNVYVATMDGSLGTKGTVLDVINKEQIAFDEYYTCGPEPMLDALVTAFPTHGQLSFEARMGCGFGACMGCSCKVKTAPYKRICVEGPVLVAEEVIVGG